MNMRILRFLTGYNDKHHLLGEGNRQLESRHLASLNHLINCQSSVVALVDYILT